MNARVTNQPTSSKSIDELLVYLFDGQSHPLTTPMGTWLAASRRFTTFANTFRDKIRKKLRTMQEQERLLDLRLELETAYLLLRERSLSVVYEPQLREVRGPDFAVSFTTSLTFMLEVTRLRTQGYATPPDTSERIADTMCSKLGQLLPQRSNILLVGLNGPCPKQGDIQAALFRIQQRAEQNDSTLLRQHRFDDRADFFRQYQRLSEILVRGSRLLQKDEPVVMWINPQAKLPLPGRVRTALYRSHEV
jgi:hypothetical protein